MKKLMILLTVSCLVCGLALGGGNGAVKMDLTDRQDTGDPKTVVGFAIANTTADSELIVQIHLDAGSASATYDVWIKVDGVNVDGPTPSGSLGTNKKGKGNTHVVVPLDPDDVGETIKVGVVVRKDTDPYSSAYGLFGEADGIAVK